MNTVKQLETSLMQRYPVLAVVKADLCRAYDLVCECHNNGGKILVCGNGGSAADSEHIVGELMKGFLLKRGLSSEDSALFARQENAEICEKLQGLFPRIVDQPEGLLTRSRTM
jgi:D-sedoheptulose 7-phosphate isomerase